MNMRDFIPWGHNGNQAPSCTRNDQVGSTAVWLGTIALALAVSLPSRPAVAQDAQTTKAQPTRPADAQAPKGQPSAPADPQAPKGQAAGPADTPQGAKQAQGAADARLSEGAKDAARDQGQQQIEERLTALIKEAVGAVDKTRDALATLDKGQTDEALKTLTEVTGQLEILIAREPELALAPASTRIIERDLLGSLPAIRDHRDRIEELVDDGQIQEARALMRGFGSEIVIETTNLPLATYPDAIKAVVAEIEAGNVERAKQTLQTALSTLVLTEGVIPLPPLRAEAVLEEARRLAAKDDLSDKEVEELMSLLGIAREQVEMGRALGYGSRAEYRPVLQAIDEIEDAVPLGERVEHLLDRAKDGLAGIFD